MAVPDFLANGFRATLFAATADVVDIIAALNTELVTNGSWTDTGGVGTGPFKSPPDALDGSFIIVTVARISATRISYVVNDNSGLLVNNQTDNRQDIDAAGCAFYVWSGPDYFCVETQRSTKEVFMVARLNVWPEVPGHVRPSFVCTRGPRNSAGTFANISLNDWFFLALGGASYGTTSPVVLRGNQGMATNFITPSGAYVYAPLDFIDVGTAVFLGRLPQCVLSYVSAYGTARTIPIDTGVTGDFRILRLLQYSATFPRFLAIRMA